MITPSTSSAGYPFPCFNTTTTRRREREVVLIDKRKTLSKSKFVFFNSLLLLLFLNFPVEENKVGRGNREDRK